MINQESRPPGALGCSDTNTSLEAGSRAMLFKEGTVPMQTHEVSGGIPIMTSPQKPVVSSTLDPLPASGTCRPHPLVIAYMTSFTVMWWVYNECMYTMNA